MPVAALLPLILEFTLKYGIPAATQLIEMFKKETITWDDWLAVFNTAATPYGLTPQIVNPVTDLGIVTPESPPTTETIPTGIDPWKVIVKVKAGIVPGTLDLCNSAGNCWTVLPGTFTRAKTGPGETWTVSNGMTFYLTAAAVAMVP